MDADAVQREVEKLKNLFEGRTAIYIEKGALHVRVSNIQADIAKGWISADVQEIPTPGFPTGMHRELASARRWKIGAGEYTTFSEHTWAMGYGLWLLFFDTRIVEGVLQLANDFPKGMDRIDRYDEILNYLLKHEAYEPSKRLFC